MSCIVCSSANPDTPGMCSFHSPREDDWSVANRVMCDLIHRGKVPVRLPTSERDEIIEYEATPGS